MFFLRRRARPASKLAGVLREGGAKRKLPFARKKQQRWQE